MRPGEIDESPLAGESPAACVRRLAIAKAAASAYRSATAPAPLVQVGASVNELILAADTLVVLDGQMLGKPKDSEHAVQMLAALSGREHTVLTGIALLEAPVGRQAATVEASRVRMARLSPVELEWYVATGEPLDKAGSYAVQGMGSLFVEAIYGNYTNVVGLPLPATYRLFASLGYDLRRFASLSHRT